MGRSPAAARAAGKRWEFDLREYMRNAGLDIEQLRLTGKEDEGDHVIRHGGLRLIGEAKAADKYDLSGFQREAQAEATNYATHRGLDRDEVIPYAAIKRRGKGTGEGYIVHTVDDFIALITRIKEQQ